MKSLLGFAVRDGITGFAGIATAVISRLDGTTEYLITASPIVHKKFSLSGEAGTNSVTEIWFNALRLDVLDKEPIVRIFDEEA